MAEIKHTVKSFHTWNKFEAAHKDNTNKLKRVKTVKTYKTFFRYKCYGKCSKSQRCSNVFKQQQQSSRTAE